MTLRRSGFPDVAFRRPVGPDHEKSYDFRRSGSATPSFGGFAFIGSLAAMVQFNFRPMTLRHRGFPGFAFYRS
jgi:hypothetical protein